MEPVSVTSSIASQFESVTLETTEPFVSLDKNWHVFLDVDWYLHWVRYRLVHWIRYWFGYRHWMWHWHCNLNRYFDWVRYWFFDRVRD
jgi:hypothetical protein